MKADPERPFHVLEPAVVTVGVAGAYPVLHLTFVCVAPGDPVGRPGETANPRWYPLGEVGALLRDSPSRFTGPTLAILTSRRGNAASCPRLADMPDPLTILSRTPSTDCSSTVFPQVADEISSAVVIGTPPCTMMARLRQNLAIASFLMHAPQNGIRSLSLS